MASLIAGMVNLAIASIILTTVLITTLKNANKSGWTSSETALWAVTSLAAIIGMVVGILQVFGIM